MVLIPRMPFVYVVALLACGLGPVAPLSAQTPSYEPPGQPVVRDYGNDVAGDYVVGPRDVLAIASYGEPGLTGEFTVETDRTFTYPLIGRVDAGGMTLREVEAELERQLVDGGFYKDPQIMVSVEEYRSQRVFVVGEVRAPGAYPLSGNLRLAEALALAGSMLPSAAGETVILPAGSGSTVVTSSAATDAGSPEAQVPNASLVTRVNLHELQNGASSENVALKDGDTVFVLRAENIYLFGQVRNPGAYLLHHDTTTVLQGLALAGGITDRGARSRIEIVRIVNGEHKKIKVDLSATVLPGDTIVVPERFF